MDGIRNPIKEYIFWEERKKVDETYYRKKEKEKRSNYL